MSQTQGTNNNYGQYSGGNQAPPVPSGNPQPSTGNYNPLIFPGLAKTRLGEKNERYG